MRRSTVIVQWHPLSVAFGIRSAAMPHGFPGANHSDGAAVDSSDDHCCSRLQREEHVSTLSVNADRSPKELPNVLHDGRPLWEEHRPIRDLLIRDLEASLRPNPDRPRWVWWGFVAVKTYGLPRVRVLWCYRLGQLALRHRLGPVAWLLQRHALRVAGAEIDPRAQIGAGLDLWHASGIVVGRDARTGTNLTLLQGVTIGVATATRPGMATIGDNVFLGAGAIVLGPVHIGDGAVVGANATVTRDVPAGATVIGPRSTVL